MSNPEMREVPVGADAASLNAVSSGNTVIENRSRRPGRKKTSATTGFRGMLLAHFENHPEDPFDYTKARKALGVTKQWMSKIRQQLEGEDYPLPQSVWEHEQQQKKEAREAAETVLFQKQPIKKRGVRTTARVKFLNILQTHLEDDADKPFDYVRVRKILGISNSKFSELKKSTYEAGFPLPTSTIEHNQWLRRQAGIPKRTSSAILRANKEERRARMKEVAQKRKKQKSVEKTIKKRIKQRISDQEAAVRNLYYLRYTYPEIGRRIKKTPSQVNHIIERLENRGEITRRLPRVKK